MKTWLYKIRLWEIALCVLVGFISHLVLTLEQSSKKITDHADKSLTNIDTNVSGIGTSTNLAIAVMASDELKLGNVLDRIIAPCSAIKGQILSVTDSKNCGLFADISRTLQTARGTLGTVESAGLAFDKHQESLYNQEVKLFNDSDSMIQGFVPIQSKLDKAIFDADSLLTSEDLTGSIHHFNTITNNIGLMTTDGQVKFHAFLYPPPCKGFKCHIGQDIQIIKTGSQFTEPAYWLYELIKAIP